MTEVGVNVKMDAVFLMLTNEMDEIRKRRATFEKMDADDAVRACEHDLDIVKRIADKVIIIDATEA